MNIFPAEWYPQQSVLITWPNEHTDWADSLMEVTECYKKIAHAISTRQQLVIICHDSKMVKEELGDIFNSNIQLLEAPYNDTWIRDYGPITVFEEEKPKWLDFQFNGWGRKFEAGKDNALTAFLKKELFPYLTLEDHLSFVLEGGSIESDGQGTLLTTSHCLMANNRNQPLSRGGIEKYLKEALGVKRILWLEFGWLEGDDTDGHIDTIARFCDEHTIAYVKVEDKNDNHFHDFTDMERELIAFANAEGKPYKLVPLPMPDAVFSPEGKRLPATYANFLIINGAVLMPIYNCKQDELAVQQLTSAFPDREVIGINCLPLIRQNGSLHCMTMQIPKFD